MSESEWTYLGDGVYAKYDGFGMLLHMNHHEDPTDMVYLEPSVLKSLNEFHDREREKQKQERHVLNHSTKAIIIPGGD